jgi:hypothetical protein
MIVRIFLVFLFVTIIHCTHYPWTTDLNTSKTGIAANRSLTCGSVYSSVEKRPIYECHDISNVQSNFTIMIVGGIHGNEPLGRELIAQLLQDATWRSALPPINILWVPDMNPDGFFHVRRENAQGVDLNRAFPDHCDGTFPDKNIPEVNGMMKMLIDVHPDLLLMFHGGARVVVWGADESCTNVNTAMPTPLDPKSQAFAIVCATAYAAHDVNKTIEGSAWYPIRGSMQDWAYYNKFTISGMVVEMGPKQPTVEEGKSLLVSHKASLLAWITSMASLLSAH